MKEIKYEKLTRRLLVNGKTVTRKSKAWKNAVVTYVCAEMSRGEDLVTILPDEERSSLPNFQQFFAIIDNDAEFLEQYSKAKQIRLNILQERLVKAINNFSASSDREAAQSLETLTRSVSVILKSKDSEQYVINYVSALPPGFWEDPANEVKEFNYTEEEKRGNESI